MTALVVGTVLALTALMWVLLPLFLPAIGVVGGGPERDTAEVEDPAIQALREIEFDRATGKLSDADYETLKASYTRRALASLRAAGSPVCDRCGPRPERDAVYCSKCGGMLSTIVA